MFLLTFDISFLPANHLGKKRGKYKNAV